ncbi:hypothetical protein Q5H94_17745 [Sphingomonas sp. CA1-15]|uniref:Uncharacterized protein n=1 Tax=Sphingomonas immobilis TaxID=3063997 RepID=A0ABT9A4N5_9SPHN|nr:hypothetical protein [Sphingomonas sp. CA1-15]
MAMGTPSYRRSDVEMDEASYKRMLLLFISKTIGYNLAPGFRSEPHDHEEGYQHGEQHYPITLPFGDEAVLAEKIDKKADRDEGDACGENQIEAGHEGRALWSTRLPVIIVVSIHGCFVRDEGGGLRRQVS